MFPFLFRKEISDQFIQANFERLGDHFRSSPFELGQFSFFQIVQPAAGTFVYPHKLSFIPKDVILLHNSTNTTVTFNYLSFDRTNISITVGGPTTLRFLLGRHENG